METSNAPALRTSRVRRWVRHLFREWTIESWRPITPASVKPEPSQWSDAQVTLAWIGHSTVLINFFGVTILTDPVLFPRIGIRLPGFTIGPKRLTAPALEFHQLPQIDVVVLSHAHFDHLDLRTLRCFDRATSVITARATSDLLKRTHFSNITELDWGESKTLSAAAGEMVIAAFPVKHWGARMQRDTRRGYNGYLIERSGGRIIFAGDTAMTESFAALRRHGPIDVAIMSISAYNPWIQSHSTPEQAVQMANAAGARFIVPVHHQTFRLSFEPFREPIERFEAALSKTPGRIALREIGQTFVLSL
jgi:L-ascorbate metabolism protein UlaG (beta-lactamase superfamily)